MNSVLNPEAPEFHPHLTSTVQDGYQQANKTIRASNTFPIGTSYDLFRTYTDFNVVTWKIRKNVVLQSNQIMVKELTTAKLKCDSDDENNTEKIIDANDSLLDRININIDTVTGVNEPSEEFAKGVRSAAWNREPVLATIKVNGGSATLIGAKNIPRPQLNFKDPVDNSEKIFVPRISDKPNNIKPLALNILYNEDGQPVGYEHPYTVELEMYCPPEDLISSPTEPHFPPGLDETPLTMIDSEETLDALVIHLDQVREIAVDLEHHSYRTYQGITCLIQISTDEGGDFIVDALALREHLHKLNQSFTDPNKIKVFHGAEHDIVWLQRDFGVYVVGMFDTHQAARLLRLGGLSLKYLLWRYCQLDMDKVYQLADWRMRPLPEALIRYARMDTHYLLFISRMMRCDLVTADTAPPQMLQAAFTNSQLVCGMTYNKPVMLIDSHMPLYLRSKKRFTLAQLTALRMLFRWRDQQARALDESTTYLLPNHMLLALAEALPRELQGLFAVCSPMPPFLKQNIDTVHRMILSCRELPDDKLLEMPPTVMGMLLPLPRLRSDDTHDLRNFPDLSEDPINLDAAWKMFENFNLIQADLRAFDDNVPADPLRVPDDLAYLTESRLKADAQIFVPPYDRYRMFREITQSEELKDIKKKEARVAAISRGNELIREEVLVPLQQAHETRDETRAETRDEPQDETRDASPALPPASKPPPEQTDENKTTIRKRKINEKPEQKEIVDLTGAGAGDAEDTRTTHKNIKDDSTVKPFFYKNVNYKKFYSDNDKGHKQPKMKFKKS